MEGSGFVKDPELKSYLSTAWAEHYSYLVQSGGRYFEKTQTIASADLQTAGDNSDSGGSYVEIPDDYLSTIGVDRKEGEHWYELEESMTQERNLMSWADLSRAGWWATINERLYLYPAPSSGQTYRHVYIPQPQQLDSVDDTVKLNVVTPDGEAFLIWSVVADVLAKEESDTGHAVTHRERARERVQEWASLRALHNPRRPQVRDPYWDFSSRARFGGEYYRGS